MSGKFAEGSVCLSDVAYLIAVGVQCVLVGVDHGGSACLVVLNALSLERERYTHEGVAYTLDADHWKWSD